MILTAMSENNYLSNDIIITFPADIVWTAAITNIYIGDLAVSDYTIGATTITIKGFLFPRANDYTITVKATGYDDSIVSQDVQIALWEQLTFYGYLQLKALESVLLSSLTSASDIFESTVKSEIRNELYKYYQHYQITGERVEGNTYFVLDHIENALEIRQAATYLAISKILYSKSISEKDVYFERYKEYNSRFKNELDFAKRRLTFETSYIDQLPKVTRLSR